MKIWSVDFEFSQPTNHLPRPICMVAREVSSGHTERVWLWDNPGVPMPDIFGPDDVYLAYNVVAEASCHYVLGWPMPCPVIDLYAEWRWFVAGRPQILGVDGFGLIHALDYFGLGHISATEKEDMRAIAIRGGPFTPEEREGLVDYCESDVVALAALWEEMAPRIDTQRAFLRGRYGWQAAAVAHHGIGIDTARLTGLLDQREDLRQELIATVDEDYGVFVDGSFNGNRWMAWCSHHGIPWPVLPTGNPRTDKDTFRDMAVQHPVIEPMRQLRSTLNELKNGEIPVGVDGRAHLAPGTFGTITGRNSPRAAHSPFQRAKWWRWLVVPRPGHVLLYADWRSQEFGIAARLSGDTAMMEAYNEGDVYLGFARRAGAVPEGATKVTHKRERDRFKIATIALQYGRSAQGLGHDLGGSTLAGQHMLNQHERAFPDFWKWSQAQADKALMGGTLHTPFGWRIIADPTRMKSNTFRNFPVQAAGADMMRLAVIHMVEAGIPLVALLHDGFLIEVPTGELEAAMVTVEDCMAMASRETLYGFELDVDFEIFHDRFRDPGGQQMWETVCRLTGLDPDLPPSN